MGDGTVALSNYSGDEEQVVIPDIITQAPIGIALNQTAQWEVGGKTIASGGAGQLNTPLGGYQLERLGIIKEKKK